MSYPCRLVDMKHFFKGSTGYISETVDSVRDHLAKVAFDLLDTFDVKRIVPLLPTFAEANRNAGSVYQNVWAHIDGTFVGICRPSEGGYRGLPQELHYSGHKCAHGNNWQGLVTPDGLFAEMHGPYVGRTNDIDMVRRSRLLDKLEKFCVYSGVRYYVFGDRGYFRSHPFLKAAFSGRHVTEDQKQVNLAMSRARVSIEWVFGKAKYLFSFIDFEKNQKLHKQPVAAYVQIAALLTNCHSCLCENEVARYFECPTPGLG